MAVKKSLGRGFDSLIPADLDKTILEEDRGRIQKVLITEVHANPSQPRKRFDEQSLSELADSVKRHGILQPIIVVADNNGYMVVAGERRLRAAVMAKLTHIPAIVRSLKEIERIEISLMENIQREDLSPIEQAVSVYKLQHQFNMTLQEIGKRLGKAESTVSNMARLLRLPAKAMKALQDGKISEGHARALLALEDNIPKQKELLKSILDNSWNVRRAEQFVISLRKGRVENKDTLLTKVEESALKDVIKLTGRRVQIKHSAHGGQIIIPFTNDKDLSDFVRTIIK